MTTHLVQTIRLQVPAWFTAEALCCPRVATRQNTPPVVGVLPTVFCPSPRSMASDSYPASPNHPSAQALSTAHPADPHAREHLSAAAQTQSLDRVLRPTNQPSAGSAAAGRHVASLGRTPSGHGVQGGGDPTVNGPRQQSVKEYRAGHGYVGSCDPFPAFSVLIGSSPLPPPSGQPTTIQEYYIPPAPPPPPPAIPSAQTAFDSAMAPPVASGVPPASSTLSRPYSPSPPPPPANYVPSPAHPPSGAPPAAPPPPPPGAPANVQAHPSPQHPAVGHQAVDAASRKSTMLGMIPMSDARSDLLAAIRRGEFSRWHPLTGAAPAQPPVNPPVHPPVTTHTID